METANLLSGVLLGSLGIGYFIYGKRQGHLLALCCGLLLCGVPYLIDSLGVALAGQHSLAAVTLVYRDLNLFPATWELPFYVHT